MRHRKGGKYSILNEIIGKKMKETKARYISFVKKKKEKKNVGNADLQFRVCVDVNVSQ